MSRLLLDEQPLVILPELARKIGLNQAIILQQIHYWLQKTKHFYDNQPWIHNTYEEWGKQFLFWSIPTIRRTITDLEKKGLVLSTNKYNKFKADKTKWYTINYEKLKEIDEDKNRELISPCDQNDQTNKSRFSEPESEKSPLLKSDQIDQSDRSNWIDRSDQNDQTNTREYTETISKKQQHKNVVEDINKLSSIFEIITCRQKNDSFFRKLLSKYDYDFIYKQMRYMMSFSHKHKMPNPEGFLIDACRENYADSLQKLNKKNNRKYQGVYMN